MKNIIRLAMSVILAIGCAYVAKSQACGGVSNTITYKDTSSALGQSNKVYGKSSTAIGLENTVSTAGSTNQAFAMGHMNQATAKLTFAFGDQNTVSQIYSFAFGQKNTVSDGYSFAIGTDNDVNANTSIALGYYLKNTKKNSMTIGMGKNKNIPFVNNTNGIMMGMNSDRPTFFISRSADAGRTGRVGVGNVTEPQAKLHIKADNYSYDGEDADILLEPTRADKKAAVYFRDMSNSIAVSDNQMTFAAPKYSFTNAGITLGKNTATQSPDVSFASQGGGISVGTDRVMSFATGKVGIGCENTADEFALAVKGGILTDDVLVRNQSQWPDYVFGKDYNLMSLPELKKFIGENKHLPDVPSEAEVTEEGVSVSEMQTVLLQKVEELTLYTIQQQEMIEQLRQQCERQQEMIEKLMGK